MSQPTIERHRDRRPSGASCPACGAADVCGCSTIVRRRADWRRRKAAAAVPRAVPEASRDLSTSIPVSEVELCRGCWSMVLPGAFHDCAQRPLERPFSPVSGRRVGQDTRESALEGTERSVCGVVERSERARASGSARSTGTAAEKAEMRVLLTGPELDQWLVQRHRPDELRLWAPAGRRAPRAP